MGNRFYFKLLLTLMVLVVVGLISLPNDYFKQTPQVKNGTIDLSAWDFEREGIVELRGEWLFSKQIGDQGGKSQKEISFAQVPGSMPNTPNRGAGTYTVNVILPQANAQQALGIDVKGVRMSNALYVDDLLLHSEGTPANTRAEYEPRNIPYISTFEPANHAFQIRIDVANFDYYKTGIHLPVYLGTAAQMKQQQNKQFLFETSVFAMSAIIAFLFIVIYFSFDKERSGLILGAYFLVLAILVATTNQKVLLQIYPDLPFLLFVKIRDFSMYFSIPLLVFYAKSLFPKNDKGWRFLKVLAFIYFTYSITSLVIPYRILGGAGDAVLLPLLLITYLIIPVSLLRRYQRNVQTVVNKREFEYFILIIFAEMGIIFSSVFYYANAISHLALLMVSSVLACLFTSLMFIEKFKKTYLSMKHYANKLEHEISLKDEFLSKTSHELKTPLHGIINFAQLSLDQVRERNYASVEKNNKLIKKTARRMALIVNDLIDFSLIKENKFRVDIGETDLLYCIHSVVEVLDYQAREKNISVHIKVPDIARYVNVDEARFIQVVFNLMQNSLYHTRNGMVMLEAKLVGQHVQLSIEDTGSGIPPSEQARIFEAYEQGANRINNGGLGLGLAISKQLLLQMNGTLKLAWSEVGKGSRFVITVPSVMSSKVSAQPTTSTYITETIQPAPTNEAVATILIVDDEPLNRAVLKELLMYQQYNVLEAQTGEQALQLLSQNKVPDIVLLDVMLEDMTGYDVCQQIRENYSLIEMPVLFITVNSSIRNISQAFSVGGNDYVTKPFEAEEVRARVQTLINMKQHAKQATENEMAFLQSQIKPHFLFNTLSAVMAYTYEDPEKTRALLQSLSVYLRTVFQTSQQTEFVTLRTEVELTVAFVAIQKQRYNERLTVKFEVDETLYHYLTPPLLLQPLVENAISHGVLKRAEGGTVEVLIKKVDESIFVAVKDDGVGMSEPGFKESKSGSGIGLANVQKRIYRLTNQSLTIKSKPQAGTTISYWIPLISNREVIAR